MRNLVVGVDGSPSSLDALAWAAATVGHHGRIHALVAVNPWTERLADLIADRDIGYRDAIESALDRTWTRDAAFAVGDFATSMHRSPVATALDEAAVADGADAIVVGAHCGHGAVRRIGSSTHRLLRTTRHPVVVVPPGAHADLHDGRVIIGLGHGDATRSAVRWAARLAKECDARIELLHATDDAPVFQADGPVDLARYASGLVDRAAWERGRIGHFADLFQALAGPEVTMEISAPHGLAALRLTEASERSAMLVIGRHRSVIDRGRHIAQPLRHVLTHARCPVAVIADHPADDLVTDRSVGGTSLEA